MEAEVEIYIHEDLQKTGEPMMPRSAVNLPLEKIQDFEDEIVGETVTFILPIKRKGYLLKAVNIWIYKILKLIYEVSNSIPEAIPGAKGDKPAHRWNGTILSLENSDGSFDAGTDLKGETGTIAAHRWAGTALSFQKPDGSFGEYVNLKGAIGDRINHRWNGTVLQIQNPDGSYDAGVDLKGSKGDKGYDGLSPLTTGAAGVEVTLPALTLGILSFVDIDLVGARPNMVPVINPPQSILANLTLWIPAIVENDKVRIYMKAGVSINFGKKTFYLKVIQ